MSAKEREAHLALLESYRMRLCGNTVMEGRLNAVEEVLQGLVDMFIKFTEEDIAQSRGG